MPKNSNGGPLRGLLDLATRILFSTPKSWPEAIWRGSMTWFLAMLVSGVFLMKDDPKLLSVIFAERFQTLTDQISPTGTRRDQVIELLRAYSNRHSPLRFALVGRTGDIAIELIWSNQDQPMWPISVDGVMSSHMREVIGTLAFGSCWSGSLTNEDGNWFFCGIAQMDDQEGYLVAFFKEDEMNGAALSDLRLLAKRIRDILFS